MEALIKEIEKCKDLLSEDGVILCPTETIWGLGCSAKSEIAIEKIKKIKNRPPSKSFICLISDFEQLRTITNEVNESWRTLFDTAEPTTVIIPDGSKLPQSILAEDGSVGIRLTTNDFCRRLIGELNSPLISTSANLSGMPTPKTPDEVDATILQKVEYVVNSRFSGIGTGNPSRIIKINKDNSTTQIR